MALAKAASAAVDVAGALCISASWDQTRPRVSAVRPSSSSSARQRLSALVDGSPVSAST